VDREISFWNIFGPAAFDTIFADRKDNLEKDKDYYPIKALAKFLIMMHIDMHN